MSFVSFILRVSLVFVTLFLIVGLNFWFFLEYSAPISTSNYLPTVNETLVKTGENVAPHVQTVRVGEGQISYEDVGSVRSYPILFFHDFFPGSRKWQHVDEEKWARENRLRIIHVDHPGYGLSNRNVTKFINLLVKAFGLEKFSVVAFGKGSTYATELSNLAESIVLLDPVTDCNLFSEYDPKTLSLGWKLISQLGFTIGLHDYWDLWAEWLNCDPKLGELLRDDRWRNMFNQSMIESFRRGITNPFTTAHQLPNFKSLPKNHLIISSKQIKCESCNAHVTNASHFEIFSNHFIESLQFIANHSTIPPKTRIIIIGGGLAGLSAAIEAHDRGAEVILIEKEARLGGNSAKATSGMNAVYTWVQRVHQINDTYDLFYNDVLVSSKFPKGKPQPLIQTLVRESKSAHEFLERHGLSLSLISQCGGHSQPRTHRDQPPEGVIRNVGMSIIQTLSQSVKNRSIEIKTSTRVTELIRENGAVVGIISNKTEFRADIVILASGGFGNDREDLLRTYAPHLIDYPSTNGPFATGDLLKAASSIGADLVDMKEIQVHPTGLVDAKNPNQKTLFLAAESLRAYGAILICNGKRFVNELGRRDEVTDAIIKHCENRTALMLLNRWGAEQVCYIPFFDSYRIIVLRRFVKLLSKQGSLVDI